MPDVKLIRMPSLDADAATLSGDGFFPSVESLSTADQSTVIGDGTTRRPLHGSGSGGNAGQMFSSVVSITPTDGSTTPLTAGALTLIDSSAATPNGATLTLPSAAAAGVGSVVGVKCAPATAGFVGYDGAITNSMQVLPIGADTLDGAPAADPNIFEVGTGIGGQLILFVSDGISKWQTVAVISQPFTSAPIVDYLDPAQQQMVAEILNPRIFGDVRNGGEVGIGPTAGTQNNYVIGGSAGVFCIATGVALVITGILNQFGSGVSANQDGVVRTIYNSSNANSITFKHLNAGSLAANRIYTPGGVDLVLAPFRAVTFMYCNQFAPFDTAPGWIVIGLV